MSPEEVAELIANMTVRERARLWARLREIEGDDPFSTGAREPAKPSPPSLEGSVSLEFYKRMEQIHE